MNTSSTDTIIETSEFEGMEYYSFRFSVEQEGLVGSKLSEDETRERIETGLLDTYGESVELLSVELLSPEEKEGVLAMMSAAMSDETPTLN